jgi:predicted RNase H-like HicB family nuclease
MRIDYEQEADGRWIAEILDLPGIMAYGETKEEAEQKVLELLAEELHQPRP